MKKKIILTAILFILIGVLFFFFKDKILINYLLTDVATKDKVSNVAENTYTREERLNDIGLVNRANIEKKVTYCFKITEQYTRDLCFDQAAKRDLNTSLCGEIVDHGTRDMCEYLITKDLAINNKDINICHKLKKTNLINSCVKAYEVGVKCNNESCLDVK